MMLIGEVAEKSGVTTSTIRYYEELGLVRPVRRESGRRLFGDDAMARLRAITTARKAGFSLQEIGRLLDSQTRGTREWRALIESKIENVDERIERLRTVAQMLRGSLVCNCRAWDECPNATQ